MYIEVRNFKLETVRSKLMLSHILYFLVWSTQHWGLLSQQFKVLCNLEEVWWLFLTRYFLGFYIKKSVTYEELCLEGVN